MKCSYSSFVISIFMLLLYTYLHIKLWAVFEKLSILNVWKTACQMESKFEVFRCKPTSHDVTLLGEKRKPYQK